MSKEEEWALQVAVIMNDYLTIKPAKLDGSRYQARKNVIKLLSGKSGAIVPYETLKLAVDRYRRFSEQKEEQFRYNCGNFFGRAGHWEEFASDERAHLDTEAPVKPQEEAESADDEDYVSRMRDLERRIRERREAV